MPKIELITNNFPQLKNCFVAGGAITSLYTNKKINDIDIYPKSAQAFEDIVYDMFENGYWCADHSDRAVTFVSGDAPPVQVMHFDTFETVEKIFEVFDFTVCMGAYDMDEQKFVLHENFLEHCSQRFLSFNPKTRYPYASAWRVKKYKEKGFTIGKFEHFKILAACANKPITNWMELREQIGGIYGEGVKVPEDEEFSVERMFEILDETLVFPKKESFENAAQAIMCLSNKEIPYFEHGGVTYAKPIDQEDYIITKIKPKNGRLIDGLEFFNNLTFYKNVKLVNNQLVSYFNKKFVYTVGEYVESGSPYIFVERVCSDLSNGYGEVTIELQADSLDDVVFNDNSSWHNMVRLKKAKVVRIVNGQGPTKPDEFDLALDTVKAASGNKSEV